MKVSELVKALQNSLYQDSDVAIHIKTLTKQDTTHETFDVNNVETDLNDTDHVVMLTAIIDQRDT